MGELEHEKRQREASQGHQGAAEVLKEMSEQANGRIASLRARATPLSEQSCGNCLYYRVPVGEDDGECRRNPPVNDQAVVSFHLSRPEGMDLRDGMDDDWHEKANHYGLIYEALRQRTASWPQIPDDEWCGEWRMAPKEPHGS